MHDPFVSEALRAHVAAEPPMGLTSAAVITVARRSRRRTIVGLAVAGAAAVSVLLIVVAMAMPRFLSGSDAHVPVAAPPDPATCDSLRDSPPGTDVGTDEAADRLTCYLLRAVPALFPHGTTFGNNVARRGTAALVAAPGGMGEGEQLVSATATVTDPAGTGMLVFAISRGDPVTPADAAARCNGRTAKATCRTGPHGEHIEIYDFGEDERGIHGRTLYVYSGHTFILAGAHNAIESRDDDQEPTRSEPPLTVEQLITLVTAPDLLLYP